MQAAPPTVLLQCAPHAAVRANLASVKTRPGTAPIKCTAGAECFASSHATLAHHTHMPIGTAQPRIATAATAGDQRCNSQQGLNSCPKPPSRNQWRLDAHVYLPPPTHTTPELVSLALEALCPILARVRGKEAAQRCQQLLQIRRQAGR
jgi:hypothetical protein